MTVKCRQYPASEACTEVYLRCNCNPSLVDLGLMLSEKRS